MNATRIDFAIGEDADFIVMAAANKQHELHTAKEMIAAGLQHQSFVLPLPEDGGISGRVVIGELTSDETEHWVARAQRPLRVESDKLVIDAGDYFGREGTSAIGQHDNHLVMQVEPGDYLVTCLVYMTSGIATDLFKRHKFSYFELFGKRYPNQAFPQWLIDEAECRDNETDEEECETIAEDQIDHEAEDRFVDVLFQFEKDGVTESPTDVSKTGKLKWEKRVPKGFPNLLPNLGTGQVASTYAVTSKIATAFSRGTFDSVVPYFSIDLQPNVSSFLAHMHRQVTEKMTVPTHRHRLESDRDFDRWIAKGDWPASLVDIACLKKHPFKGSCLCELVAEPTRGKRYSVSLHTAFSKTADGLRVSAIEVSWKVPIERKRRRARIAEGPPCPECGEQLATALAKQCIHCGANWH